MDFQIHRSVSQSAPPVARSRGPVVHLGTWKGLLLEKETIYHIIFFNQVILES